MDQHTYNNKLDAIIRISQFEKETRKRKNEKHPVLKEEQRIIRCIGRKDIDHAGHDKNSHVVKHTIEKGHKEINNLTIISRNFLIDYLLLLSFSNLYI